MMRNKKNIIHEKMNQGKKDNTFKRVDSNHKLDIFLGYSKGNKPTITILDFGSVENIESSQYIETMLFKQVDGKISLSFVLKDIEIYDIFIKFCEDIIESTREIQKNKVIDFIIARWNIWKNAFKNIKNNSLSESQIIGLFGELIFLKEYLIPRYGEKVGILGWQGIEMLSKDFEIENTWYEVKTKINNGTNVTINSAEQLDSTVDGNLGIVKLRKTNETNDFGYTINKYVEIFKEELENYEVKKEFESKLIRLGYIEDEAYEKYSFIYENVKIYDVKEGFPRICKSDLRNGITGVVYQINLESINIFEKERLLANEHARV